MDPVSKLSDKSAVLDSCLDLQGMAERMTGISPEDAAIEMGYTYFGQFISHDLIPGAMSGRHESEFIFKLNLDSLYGFETDLNDQKCLVDSPYLDSDGTFYIPCDSDSRDVIRENGIPKIPEIRNAENFIVLQLHRVWQDFHNELIRKNIVESAIDAREWTVKVFQIITIKDYLHDILDSRVWDFLFYSSYRFIDFEKRIPNAFFPNEANVPAFFTHAAFRFGHTMARDQYNLNNDNQNIDLEMLMSIHEPLPGPFAIDWSFFFNDGAALPANGIDTWLTEDLSRVPTPKGDFNLAHKNLVASTDNNVKTGTEYIDALYNYFNSIDSPDAVAFSSLDLQRVETVHGASFEPFFNCQISRLPLWPYILYEAQSQAGSKHLGLLGSIMVGECLFESIKNSDFSIIEHGNYHYDSIVKSIPKKLKIALGLDVHGDFTIVNVLKFIEQWRD